jgi:DNA polymerase V
MQVYIRTNPHKANAPQYQRGLTIPLPEPTDDTLLLTKIARWGLKRIYRPGFAYQKAGIALMNLRDAGTVQMNLFSKHKNNSGLMQVMDQINDLWGRGTLHPGAEGLQKDWKMKREKKSPGYTTCWDQLPVACCNYLQLPNDNSVAQVCADTGELKESEESYRWNQHSSGTNVHQLSGVEVTYRFA